MKKYKYIFLIGIVLVIATIVFTSRAVDSLNFRASGDEKFNKKLWIELADSEQRLEMINDLQVHYLRKGLTKAEVIELLGNPDGSGHYTPIYSDTSSVISYNMGYVFLDPCTFELEFSTDGRLISYKQNCN